MKSSVRTFCSKDFRHWYYEHERSNLMKKCAFTLAEVLITLGIIGVVAAITLPILIQNYQKTVWVNQLKKSVSVLENGFKLAMAEDEVDKLNNTMLWQSAGSNCTGGVTDSNCSAFFDNLKKYIKITLDTVPSNVTFTNLNDSNSLTWIGNPDKAVSLAHGAQIYFIHNITQTPGSGWGAPHANIANIFIDVNGKQKPNKLGRDLFYFGVVESGLLIPYGSRASTSAYCSNAVSVSSAPPQAYQQAYESCLSSLFGSMNWETATNGFACSSEGSGLFCAARIIDKGWKMDY